MNIREMDCAGFRKYVSGMDRDRIIRMLSKEILVGRGFDMDNISIPDDSNLIRFKFTYVLTPDRTVFGEFLWGRITRETLEHFIAMVAEYIKKEKDKMAKYDNDRYMGFLRELLSISRKYGVALGLYDYIAVHDTVNDERAMEIYYDEGNIGYFRDKPSALIYGAEGKINE